VSKYDDIINITRPLSARNKMSMLDRAAQFAPFAALEGFDDSIDETARLVDERIELDEESYSILDAKFIEIKEKFKEHPLIRITYFVRDKKKSGGKYITKNVHFKKIDEDNHLIIFEDESKIDIDDVYYLEII